MDLSHKKNIANQIKTFFILVFIAGGINLVIYIALSVILKPPINPPVPKEVIQSIRNSRGSGITFVGNAFQETCKYDNGMPISVIEDDRINEFRNSRYKKDVKKQFGAIWPWTFVVIILGFYLIKGADWVLIYSSDDTQPTNIDKSQENSFTEKSKINVKNRKSVPWICRYCGFENTINEISCEKCNRK